VEVFDRFPLAVHSSLRQFSDFKSSQQHNITIARGAYVSLMLLVNSLVESTRKYYAENYVFVERIYIVTGRGYA
jgi:hypothetical protein